MGVIFNSMAKAGEKQKKSNENISAELYSFDLLGSSLGALAGGVILIPAAGPFITTAGLAIGLGLFTYFTKGK